MPFINTTYRKLSKVNGKITENIFLHKSANNYRQIINGHFGKTPIYFRTNFKKNKTKRNTRKYRR
jgi:hypothetical protein